MELLVWSAIAVVVVLAAVNAFFVLARLVEIVLALLAGPQPVLRPPPSVEWRATGTVLRAVVGRADLCVEAWPDHYRWRVELDNFEASGAPDDQATAQREAAAMAAKLHELEAQRPRKGSGAHGG